MRLQGATSMPHLLWFFGIATCVKLLLIPSYHSTDFEVHRNWLALTHSLPLSQWYSDETSPWTLDYPPFFAFFERFLSIFANLIDPQIVHLLKGLNYSSNTVVLFQRITVILSDLCILYGVYRLTKVLDSKRRTLIWVLVIWSPMLVIVDHVHFQYNGFLLGFLFISLSYLEEGRDLMGGFFFAVLLCFKHLFAVAAPVYFVYLLRHYCCGGLVRGLHRLSALAVVVTAVFVAAFAPFVYHGQIQQVLHRMFPFGRGLCHAYWAPNFWVFYIILDKLLAFFLRKFGFAIPTPAASFTGGLVGDSSPFSILPQITPLATFIIVLLALSPCLIKAWREPRPGMVTRWVAYAYTCGFLFGWHVHEKALLHFVIPLATVAVQNVDSARHYYLLSIGYGTEDSPLSIPREGSEDSNFMRIDDTATPNLSSYSLFPLLFEVREYPIKVLLLLLYSIIMWLVFSAQFTDGEEAKATSPIKKEAGRLELKGNGNVAAKKGGFVIRGIGKSYLVGLLVVEIWGQLLHSIFFGERLPFVPLMLISIYCGLGIVYSWIWQLRWIIRSPES